MSSPRISRAWIAFTFLCAPAFAQDLYDIDHIRTIEVFTDPNWRTVMEANFPTSTYISANLLVDGQLYQNVGVRHRGNSTYRFLPASKTDKRPWEISLDEFVPGQRIQGYRRLNINNNVWDPSFVREVAGYEFLRRYVPTPKSNYVRLRVNGEDLGLFANTQQVDKEFLQEWYEDDEGNRYRGEISTPGTPWNHTALNWLGPSIPPYQDAYQLKTENGPPPWQELVDAIDVLNNTPIAQLPAQLPTVIDVDEALRFLAGANLVAWLDSYIGEQCHNFYVYADPRHGRLSFVPWDMNNAFGGLMDGLSMTALPRIDPFRRATSTGQPRPLLGQTVQVPAWRARYLAHYRHMLQAFDWSIMGPRIQYLRALIRPELQNDPKRIYTMNEFDLAMTREIDVGFITVPPIEPFFVDRTAFLRAHPDLAVTEPALSSLSHRPSTPRPQDTTWINVHVQGANRGNVTLHHRVRGAYVETAMWDDGNHGDGAANDGVYGAAIPPQAPFSIVQYFVSATTAANVMGLLPKTAGLEPPSFQVGHSTATSPVRINEFVASNASGLQDPAGEFDDWLELANTSPNTVDLSDMYLTDDSMNPTKWQIPLGTTLAPRGKLIVWCDEDGNQGPLHANFKLGASGEEILLFDTDGTTLLDSVTFGPQTADVSTGRLAGHETVWATFPEPTPLLDNTANPCGHLRYDRLDSRVSPIALEGTSSPRIGGTASYDVRNAPASAPGLFVLSTAPLQIEIGAFGALLIDPVPTASFPFRTDTLGFFTQTFPIPNDTNFVGRSIYAQAFATNGSTGGLSNGVVTVFCP